MSIPFRHIVPVFVVLLTGAALASQEGPPVGQKVVTRFAQPIRVENRTVDDGSQFRVYTVEAVDDGIVTVSSGDLKGWL